MIMMMLLAAGRRQPAVSWWWLLLLADCCDKAQLNDSYQRLPPGFKQAKPPEALESMI
jgi:hypothetical protein